MEQPGVHEQPAVRWRCDAERASPIQCHESVIGLSWRYGRIEETAMQSRKGD